MSNTTTTTNGAPPMPGAEPLTAYRVHLANGTSYVTSMAAGVTLIDAKNYFLGKNITLRDETTFLCVDVTEPEIVRHTVTAEEAVAIVDGIRSILFRDGDNLDGDKEQDLEALEAVTGTLEDAGLAPSSEAEPVPYQPVTLAPLVATDEPAAIRLTRQAVKTYLAFMEAMAELRTQSDVHIAEGEFREWADDFEDAREVDSAPADRLAEIYAAVVTDAKGGQ